MKKQIKIHMIQKTQKISEKCTYDEKGVALWQLLLVVLMTIMVILFLDCLLNVYKLLVCFQ